MSEFNAESIAVITEKLERASENVPLVYDAGGTAQYDEFWNALQENGERRDYSYAFSGSMWNDSTFKPKYPITASGSCSHMFYNCLIRALPCINLSGVTEFEFVIHGCTALRSIEKIILPNPTLISGYGGLLDSCEALEDVAFEGVIGYDIDLCLCDNLSFDSINSLINALDTELSGLTAVLSALAVDRAFESSPGASDGSRGEVWLSLVATRPGWSIELYREEVSE